MLYSLQKGCTKHFEVNDIINKSKNIWHPSALVTLRYSRLKINQLTVEHCSVFKYCLLMKKKYKMGYLSAKRKMEDLNKGHFFLLR